MGDNPVKVFPNHTLSISLTGKECALSCKHCNKHYLCHMLTLAELERRIALNHSSISNITSLLISGGCDSSGTVPLLAHEARLKSLRKKFRLVAHTGFGELKRKKSISEIADVVSFNLIGDTETLRNVYGVQKLTSDQLMENFLSLSKHVRTVPHITIGLNGSKISGEYRAVDFLAEQGIRELVFNVLIPTPMTEFSSLSPVPVLEVLELLAYARPKFSSLTLGCMRPSGLYRKSFDSQALPYLDRIVNPSIPFKTDSEILRECCVL